MAEGLDWLPDDGVVLTRADLERIFVSLRALIAGTGRVDPNRSFAVDIAIAITHASNARVEANDGEAEGDPVARGDDGPNHRLPA
jgi:hypothetical protein